MAFGRRLLPLHRLARRARAAATAGVAAWRNPPRADLPSDLAGQAEWQEDFYLQADDPWGFESSPYERAKYEHTLAVVQEAGAGRRFGRALEVGCSIGVFTTMLAPHCDELVAADISHTAVSRARARVDKAGHGHVVVERRTIPLDMPTGVFDLVLCSDVLYYFEGTLLDEAIDALLASLDDGGLFVVASWLGKFGPIGGLELHEHLATHVPLTRVHSETKDDDGPQGIGYRLDVWRR